MFRRALSIWAAWTVFALFTASQTYLSRAYSTPIEWKPAFQYAFLDCYLWAALTPLAFLTVGRAPRWRRLPLLLVASVAFAALHLAVFMTLLPRVGYPASRRAIQAIPSTKFHSNLLTCWALFGIRYYITRERRANRLSAQLAVAQLEVLKMQLQPHFLFNTLHAISALMYRNVEDADRMLTRLSDFLRLTIDSAGVQEVTLNREFEYLDKYLEIEQVRFGPRLEVRREIAVETLDLLVPNLVLQPLAENAVRHGIAPRSGGGRIDVTARIEGGQLIVSVSDDGPGAVAPIREGVGISNTRVRLEQLYGGAGRLELSNAPGGGFCARLEAPAHSEPVAGRLTG